jgi:hypothetical protein
MGLSAEVVQQAGHPVDQRGYVWRRSQVPFLLDTLYRGYSVGALMIWKTTGRSGLVPVDPTGALA